MTRDGRAPATLARSASAAMPFQVKEVSSAHAPHNIDWSVPANADLSVSAPARFSPTTVIIRTTRESFCVNVTEDEVTLQEQGITSTRPLSESIMHPENRLPHLLKFYPFRFLNDSILSWHVECERARLLSGDGILVGPDTFPEVHDAYMTACRALGFDVALGKPPPDLFVYEGGVNASAMGTVDGPNLVAISAGSIDVLDKEEITFVLAHELGHIAFGHSLSKFITITIATWITPALKGILSSSKYDTEFMLLNVTRIVVSMVEYRSSRTCEFTADRCGLLAVRNPRTAISALARMQGGQALQMRSDDATRALMEQFERRSEKISGLSLLWSQFMDYLRSHPTLEQRARHMVDFGASDEFAKILNDEEPTQDRDTRQSFSRTCKKLCFDGMKTIIYLGLTFTSVFELVVGVDNFEEARGVISALKNNVSSLARTIIPRTMGLLVPSLLRKHVKHLDLP